MPASNPFSKISNPFAKVAHSVKSAFRTVFVGPSVEGPTQTPEPKETQTSTPQSEPKPQKTPENKGGLTGFIATAGSILASPFVKEEKKEIARKSHGLIDNALFGAGVFLGGLTFGPVGAIGMGLIIRNRQNKKTGEGRSFDLPQKAVATGSTIAGIAIGNSVGAVVGSVAGPIGALIGKSAGSAIGGIIGRFTGKKAASFLSSLPGAGASNRFTLFGDSLPGKATQATQNMGQDAQRSLIPGCGCMTILFIFIIFFVIPATFLIPNSGNKSKQPPGHIDFIGSCPITDGVLLCGSYDGSASCKHGSNPYWTNRLCDTAYCSENLDATCCVKGYNCRWSMPTIDKSCWESPYSDNVCYNPSSTCTVYGFAADFQDPDARANAPVYLPQMEDQTLTWTRSFAIDFIDRSGAGGLMRATDGSNVYEMYFMHLNDVVPLSGQSGDLVGTLFQLEVGTPHVHIELRINGQIVRPDSLC